MKLISLCSCRSSTSLFLPFCFLLISSHLLQVSTQFPPDLICIKLCLAKFPAKSSTSGPSSAAAAIPIGLLHTQNRNTLSLQLSRTPSNSLLLRLVRLRRAPPPSDAPAWTSPTPLLSSLLVLRLDANGSLALCDGRSVLWRSHTCGIQVTSVELLKAGKAALLDNCRPLQRSERRKISRGTQPTKHSRGAILQEIVRESTADGSPNSVDSEAHAPPIYESEDTDGSPGHRNKKILAMEIVFPVLGSLLLLALCIAMAILARRGRLAQMLNKVKKRTAPDVSAAQKSIREQEDEALLESLGPGLPPRFTYAEMEEATGGFAKKLGEGGFGAVYEGTMSSSGARIAVKIFHDTASMACRMGFCREVMSIGEKQHQNLVQLQGFCVEDEHRMLVYELMEKGSLNKLLFGGKAREESEVGLLSWERRRAIAIDTARALAFLHQEEEGKQKRAVIHCDVKPENILLDGAWVAKVSDFGLAKLLWGASHAHHPQSPPSSSPGASSSTATWDTSCLMSGLISSKGVRGTLGYLAPEWVRVDAGPDTITTASDVYSFGVVLLELIAGRRSMVPGHPFLPGRAFDMLANGEDLSQLLDSRLLEGSSHGISCDDLEDARNFVKVALWCIQEDIALRPTMENIVTMLTNKDSVSLPPFCDYFAGSSHFFDEANWPPQEPIFNSSTFSSHDKRYEISTPSSYEQSSWQISILSGR